MRLWWARNPPMNMYGFCGHAIIHGRIRAEKSPNCPRETSSATSRSSTTAMNKAMGAYSASIGVWSIVIGRGICWRYTWLSDYIRVYARDDGLIGAGLRCLNIQTSGMWWSHHLYTHWRLRAAIRFTDRSGARNYAPLSRALSLYNAIFFLAEVVVEFSPF